MSANNVLKFPNIGTPPAINETELAKQFLENKKDYVDEIVEHYSMQVVNRLGMHGFDIFSEEFLNDYSYTTEILRATLYRSLKLDHPLIEHIEKGIAELEVVVDFDGEDDFDDDL